jgi:hypothetical protein
MLKSDQVLWEQELAEHLNLHADDLLKMPPARARFAAMSRSRRRWTAALLVWTPVAIVGTTVGWSVGWYLV